MELIEIMATVMTGPLQVEVVRMEERRKQATKTSQEEGWVAQWLRTLPVQL